MKAPQTYGLPILDTPVPVSTTALRLVTRGVRELWQRIVAADPGAESRPLLLSYDVHPTPAGPVLIEVNTNAGGVLTAIRAAQHANDCCPDAERNALVGRLLALFQRDLLGPDAVTTGHVAIVDDRLATQPLLPEMFALAELLRPYARRVSVVDAEEVSFRGGRLWHGAHAIDRIYWRSTDFLLTDPVHDGIRRAVEAGSVLLAPSPAAYRAIADKRRLLDWSGNPFLGSDDGSTFQVAETRRLSERGIDAWYAERADWVFKPIDGFGSRGVYVGKSISRARLASLPPDQYLAQRYTPHPVVDRDGREWKYDVRLFADRGEVIGAAARVFHGQVVGMKVPGSGFAPLRVGEACCLVGAMGASARDAPNAACRTPV